MEDLRAGTDLGKVPVLLTYSPYGTTDSKKASVVTSSKSKTNQIFGLQCSQNSAFIIVIKVYGFQVYYPKPWTVELTSFSFEMCKS
jgi:hypothetical protein